MELNLTSWSEYKALLIQKNPNWQHVERDESYYLFFFDGDTQYSYSMPKDSGADQTEWEATYKPRSNFAIGNRGYAFSTNDFTYKGDAVYGVCTAGQTLDLDYTFAETLYTDGGDIVLENSVLGDWVEVYVVHPTYGVVADYVKKRYVPASPAGLASPLMIVKTPYAGKIPAGLKLRLTYHSTGTLDVKVGVNYNLHLPI